MIEKILAIAATLALFFVIGFISYHEFYRQEVKVIVNLKQGEDPFVAIKHIVPADSAIREVHELDRKQNQYEITVETRRKRQGLLEWFLKNHRVERAELMDE